MARWRHQTVQGHVAHPPVTPREQQQNRSTAAWRNLTAQGHVAHPPRPQNRPVTLVSNDGWRNMTVQGHVPHPPRQNIMRTVRVPSEGDRQILPTAQGHVAHPPRQQYGCLPILVAKHRSLSSQDQTCLCFQRWLEEHDGSRARCPSSATAGHNRPSP
jgi:hypothetical protein